MSREHAPSPILRRWEALPAQLQAAIVFPPAAVLLFLLHLGPLSQPLGRAVGYAIFWAAVVTTGVVVASRAERARRLGRAHSDEGQRPC